MNPSHDFSHDFSMAPGHVWLNVASEGPLPNAAVQALQEATTWKQSPHLLTIPKFQQVPLGLKNSLGRLIRVDAQDIILGNSATYGLHLLANGLAFKAGEEIILLQNDFPSDILPWLSLQRKGVVVRQLKAKSQVLSVEEVASALCMKTRLVCLPYVHSFSGCKQDIKAIGQLCQEHGILLVVNVSQAAGVIDIDVNEWPVDALVCAGYKWLLGPYGTGFCWMTKAMREQLNYPQNYWASLMDERSLASEGPLTLKDDHSTRRYDVFGTANFFNYVPWQASIEYLLSLGMPTIEQHNRLLVSQILKGLDRKRFDVLSPENANMVVLSYQDATCNIEVFEYLKKKKFYAALWKGKLRVSPHIYNTPEDIRKFLATLNAYAPK